MNTEITKAILKILPFILIILVIHFRIRQGKINPQDLSLAKPKSLGIFLSWIIGFLFFILGLLMLLGSFFDRTFPPPKCKYSIPQEFNKRLKHIGR